MMHQYLCSLRLSGTRKHSTALARQWQPRYPSHISHPLCVFPRQYPLVPLSHNSRGVVRALSAGMVLARKFACALVSHPTSSATRFAFPTRARVPLTTINRCSNVKLTAPPGLGGGTISHTRMRHICIISRSLEVGHLTEDGTVRPWALVGMRASIIGTPPLLDSYIQLIVAGY